jgi:hypothetical protein
VRGKSVKSKNFCFLIFTIKFYCFANIFTKLKVGIMENNNKEVEALQNKFQAELEKFTKAQKSNFSIYFTLKD